jgi:hypothetical protein
MGMTNFSAIGFGMTEQEAKRNALEMDREENGHQEGYSGTIGSAVGQIKSKCLQKPKPAKTCAVKRDVQKGTRKWETVFVLKDWYGKTLATVRTTQGDAIEKAKYLAIQQGNSVKIEIKKVLVNDSSIIATVSPKKSIQGKWLFTGDARE